MANRHDDYLTHQRKDNDHKRKSNYYNVNNSQYDYSFKRQNSHARNSSYNSRAYNRDNTRHYTRDDDNYPNNQLDYDPVCRSYDNRRSKQYYDNRFNEFDFRTADNQNNRRNSPNSSRQNNRRQYHHNEISYHHSHNRQYPDSNRQNNSLPLNNKLFSSEPPNWQTKTAINEFSHDSNNWGDESGMNDSEICSSKVIII